jgi:hypothetical protein
MKGADDSASDNLAGFCAVARASDRTRLALLRAVCADGPCPGASGCCWCIQSQLKRSSDQVEASSALTHQVQRDDCVLGERRRKGQHQAKNRMWRRWRPGWKQVQAQAQESAVFLMQIGEVTKL